MISGVSQYNNYATGIDLAALQSRREEMFAKMDANGNGYIDKVELKSFGEQLAGQAKGPSADELMSRMDTDGDGQISKAEFDAAEAERANRVASRRPGPPPPKEDLFSLIDTNGDGSVDKTELETFMQQSAAETGQTEDSEDVFSAIDTDGDGQISQAEFIAAMAKVERAMMAAMADQGRLEDASLGNTAPVTSESSASGADGDSIATGNTVGRYVYAYQPAVQPILNLFG
jgi:Ca2+-binding EF-hand superfamily protein